MNSPAPAARSVLVIGASRGLGLALAREWLSRGWQVTATTRGTARTPLHDDADRSDGRLTVESLDMTEPDSLATLARRLAGHRLHTLFINAGVANGAGDSVDDIETDEFTRLMLTNALAPMRVIEALAPLVEPAGTVAAMSSSLGSVTLNDRGGWEVYRASKAALNTLMRSYAARTAGSARTLVLMDPGWVRTDMGGPAATLSIEESIPGVVDTLDAQSGQPGLRYLNYRGQTLPW